MLGPHAGQTTNSSSNEEVVERMRAEIRKVKTLTDKPFAVPVMISENPAMVPLMRDLILEEKVPVVLINVALDPELFTAFKQAGIKIIYRAFNPTIASSLEAEGLGADVLVVTDFDESGSVPSQTMGTFSVISHITDALKIPVMAAGGISEIRGVRATFVLGAEGIYLGTAFLVTHESPTAGNVKQLLVESSAEDLLIYRTQTLNSYYRSLPTKLVKKMVEEDNRDPERGVKASALMQGTVGMRKGMLEGDLENGYISVGNGITYIKEICSVQALIDDLMRDFI